VREVPGCRLEMTPFGGNKDAGLGYKEGVLEAMKSFLQHQDLFAALVKPMRAGPLIGALRLPYLAPSCFIAFIGLLLH